MPGTHHYFRTALRFPKRDTAALRWIRTFSIVGGVLSLLQALTWLGTWHTAVAVLLALAWFTQTYYAAKEIRRRAGEAPGPHP
ncbi:MULTISPECIES: hypothetical protein [unclassified Pseudarthrobacter]|uniref:hypothetical protein n=1 Tax=unclassified Pseudarthrobacter TaxID=2647000 RepID=UPI00362BD4F3